MNLVRFEKAVEADISLLGQWMRAFYLEEKLPFCSKCESAVRELIRDGRLGWVVLLHKQGDSVGYFVLTFGFSIERGGKTATLDELYIVPEARGEGSGKAAVADAKRLAQEAGCQTIFVEVDRANACARGLYKKYGFVDIGRDYLAAQL